MQKIIHLSIYSLFFYTYAYSQTPENAINLYGTNFPQEKIHIHFDKESYLPGETIWFKAYLFEENLPSERSTNFYVALYDEQGKILQQQIAPIFNSSTDGHFDLPDTLQSAQLICRAYTTWMLNFDTSFLFNRAIRIIQQNTGSDSNQSVKMVSLQFFPEGGDIIEGTVNTIAFKANYNNGLPFHMDGVLKKQETGEVIMPLKVVHDGMGKFDLDFKAGDKYYAEWIDNNGNRQQTWLPDAKQKGVSLKLNVQKDKLYYNLVNKTGSDSLHVLMYMYQRVFYKTNLSVTETEPFTGIIPISTLPAGTMQLTVFDAHWQPVAERVAFIRNDNAINVFINTKEISTQKRAKNMLEIYVADTVPANMSLSISDAEINTETSENTIVSDFLLKGDLKGYIHNPAYYFTGNNAAEEKANLDLVMLTNGWRRYNWADMMVQKMPKVNYPADDYLGVYGQIGPGALDKLDKDEKVNLIIKTIDSTNFYYSIPFDKKGLLKQTGLVFYDSVKVYYSINKNKKYNDQVIFGKFNFTYPVPDFIRNYKDYTIDSRATGIDQNTALYKYYTEVSNLKKFNDEKTLRNVMVKSRNMNNWKNNPLLKMDERYASGLFSGGALGYSFDVAHDERAWTKLDLFSYIRHTVPGLMVGSYDMISGSTLTWLGQPVYVFIDEFESTTSDLQNLSITDVAYIKLIPNYIGSVFGATDRSLNRVIAVYTRKGDDLIDRRPKESDLGMVKIAGYSPVKEFYSPDYSLDNTSEKADVRTTLLWQPYIFTDANNHKIPISFYNNDFTKKIRIVLEGINEEGKLIHIERIIE